MDKKASDIIGLPVVTRERGTKIYEVEDLLLDPQRKQVLALLVREGSLFHSARAIPFGRILAIGPDALIVADSRAVIEVDRDPVLRALSRDKVSVQNWRVMTEGGRRLGTVTDMLLDSHTGEIKGFNVSTGGVPTLDSMHWLPMEAVLSMGQLILYVPDSYAAAFEGQRGGWTGALVMGKTATRDVRGEGDTLILRAGETVTPESVETARASGKLPDVVAAVGEEPGRSSLLLMREGVKSGWERVRAEGGEVVKGLAGAWSNFAGQSDERLTGSRIRNALGRPVTRVILDPDDNVILDTGDIITHRAVEAARQAGVLDVLLSSVYVERPKLDAGKLRLGASASVRDESSRARGSGDASAAPPGEGEAIIRQAEEGRGELADSNEASRQGGYGPVSDS